VFLSDRDVSDFGAGVACTNLRVAEKEVGKLRDLFAAVQWLRSKV
jgi:hypothetical protein